MSEWFSNFSAFTVFLSIAVIGFLFLLISLIFGEVFEFFEADTDFDHGGPSFFSTRVLSVFITTFGAVGAIGVRYGMGTGAASATGAASGVALGSLIYFFARFLLVLPKTRSRNSAERFSRVRKS